MVTKKETKFKTTKKPKAKPKAKAPVYVSVKAELVHPFASIRIPVGSPGVQLDRDSWLDSQLESGLVKEL